MGGVTISERIFGFVGHITSIHNYCIVSTVFLMNNYNSKRPLTGEKLGSLAVSQEWIKIVRSNMCHVVADRTSCRWLTFAFSMSRSLTGKKTTHFWPFLLNGLTSAVSTKQYSSVWLGTVWIFLDFHCQNLWIWSWNSKPYHASCLGYQPDLFRVPKWGGGLSSLCDTSIHMSARNNTKCWTSSLVSSVCCYGFFVEFIREIHFNVFMILWVRVRVTLRYLCSWCGQATLLPRL